MRKFQNIVRWLAMPLAALFLTTTLAAGTAQAGLITTDSMAREHRVDTDRERVLSYIDRSEVQKEMMALGVSPDEAKERVAAMSDEEIVQVAERMDQIPAGEGAIGAIIGAALIIFIVLLITDVAGVTHVFSFTQ